MKTKKAIRNSMLVVSVLAILLGGCRKKEKEDKDTQAATDNEQMEATANDVSNIADAAAAGVNSFRVGSEEGSLNTMSPCATVTRDTVNHTIDVDFGTTNCLCVDNRNRRGIIHIAYSGVYYMAGSTRTITFNNFYVNDNKVEGTHTVTANGNSSGHYTWTVQAIDMKVTRPDGREITWNSTRTRTMLAGETTPFIRNDDVYEVTGSASGVNINGVPFTAEISVPLHRELSCQWIQSGTITITPQGRPARVLDFGSGGCDNQATVTINGTAHTINLH